MFHVVYFFHWGLQRKLVQLHLFFEFEIVGYDTYFLVHNHTLLKHYSTGNMPDQVFVFTKVSFGKLIPVPFVFDSSVT